MAVEYSDDEMLELVSMASTLAVVNKWRLLLEVVRHSRCILEEFSLFASVTKRESSYFMVSRSIISRPSPTACVT